IRRTYTVRFLAGSSFVGAFDSPFDDSDGVESVEDASGSASATSPGKSRLQVSSSTSITPLGQCCFPGGASNVDWYSRIALRRALSNLPFVSDDGLGGL